MNKKNVFKQFKFQKTSDSTDRICEKDECQAIGKFKAPISRNNLRKYKWKIKFIIRTTSKIQVIDSNY